MKKKVPCVGFELQYSPLQRDCVENLAAALHPKSSEFIFDVIQEVQAGNEILVLFSNKQGPTQQLSATVKDCTQIDNDHYQVALVTNSQSHITTNNSEQICLPIIKGVSAPAVITLHCPACSTTTAFYYIANQDGDWEHGILPIYNCSSCGTTRAMIGLINT